MHRHPTWPGVLALLGAAALALRGAGAAKPALCAAVRNFVKPTCGVASTDVPNLCAELAAPPAPVPDPTDPNTFHSGCGFATSATVDALQARIAALNATVAALEATLRRLTAAFPNASALDAATLGGLGPGDFSRRRRVVIYEPTLGGLSPTGPNIGGRAGADAKCAASGSRPAGYFVARALISVSPTDEIRDMPQNYNVPTDAQFVSLTGKVLAESWAELMGAGGPRTSMRGGGVLTGTGDVWWSGSGAGGAVDASACDGWTTAVAGPTSTFGRVGSATLGTGAWMSSGQVPCRSDYQLPILCLAY